MDQYARQIRGGYLYPNKPNMVHTGRVELTKKIYRKEPKTLGGKKGELVTTMTPNITGSGWLVETTFLAYVPDPEDPTKTILAVDSTKNTQAEGATSSTFLSKQMNYTKDDWKKEDAALQSSMDKSESSVTTPYEQKQGEEKLGIQDGASAADSLIKQPAAAKDLLKIANKADKKKTIQKQNLYPTVATGSALKTYPDATTMVADYYRFGKFTPGEKTYEIMPKQFDPIVNDKVTSSIRVIGQSSDTNKPSDLIPAYTKFIIETVQESHTERSQIVETFGDFYMFMFGERPPIYNFTGQLINSQNANWVMDFMFMYNEYLRGTRCVERNAKVLLTYGGRQIEGLILNTASQTNAAVEGAVGFSFSVVVFERKYFNFSPDMGYYTSDNQTLTEDGAFRKTLGLVAAPSGKGTSTKGVSDAINAAKDVCKGGPAAGYSPGPSGRGQNF